MGHIFIMTIHFIQLIFMGTSFTRIIVVINFINYALLNVTFNHAWNMHESMRMTMQELCMIHA